MGSFVAGENTPIKIDTHTANFNSHARVGRDLVWLQEQLNNNISTHTPVWGVTDNALSASAKLCTFQLTRPCGA